MTPLTDEQMQAAALNTPDRFQRALQVECLRSIDAKLGTIKNIAIFWFVAVPILAPFIALLIGLIWWSIR